MKPESRDRENILIEIKSIEEKVNCNGGINSSMNSSQVR